MSYVPFSDAVRAIIIKRATDLKDRIWCESCGAECAGPSSFHIDHVVAEGRRVRPHKLTARDGQLLCRACHFRKTKRDVSEIAKAKRLAGGLGEARGRGPTEIARRFGIRQEDSE